MGSITKYIGGLRATMKEALEETKLPELQPFEEKLRASGFPFCGLRHAYRKMKRAIDGEEQPTFGKPYYCGAGTVTHEILQRYVGHTGTILGNWKCYDKKCGGERILSHKRRCPKCKGEMEYVELTVGAYRYVSGHVDGVWRAPDGKYFVIDYKTSSVYNIRKQKTTPTFPYITNKAQIKAYCALVEQNHGIEISGWMLIYISRDDPTKVYKIVGDTISRSEKLRIMRMLGTYDGHFKIAKELRSFKSLLPLIEEKPCRCYDDYEEHYKAIEECPLRTVCFSEQRLKETLKMTWLEYKPLKQLENKHEEDQRTSEKESARTKRVKACD